MFRLSKRTTGQLIEYARGIGGGLIFGLPILFTQEIWEQGFIIDLGRLAAFLFLQYLLLLGYVYYAGLRVEYSFGGVAFEAVETLGIAFLLSALILFITAQITPGMSIEEMLGKIVLETIPVSIGVALASVQLGERSREEKERLEKTAAPGTFGQFVVAVGGAVFFAFNLAATEEITLMGLGINWWQAILLMLVSLAVTYGIVFRADFKGTHGRRQPTRMLETPFGETMAAYATSLVVSAVMLFLLGRVSPSDSFIVWVYQSVVLALPASLGAAAGRLII